MPAPRTNTALRLFFFLGSSAAYNFTENVLSHSPNETRSITFKPFPEDPDLGDSNWMWHVNITDVPLPNEKITYPQSGDGSPDSRGLVATYDPVWPEGGVLFNITSRNAPKVCATVPITVSRLPNVTNAWLEDNTESLDCAPVLGQACVDAVLETGKLDSDTNEGGCRLSKPWTELSECRGVLYRPARNGNDSERNGWYGAITRGIGSLESAETLDNGLMNYIYDGKESMSLHTSALNMLQVVLLHSQPPSPALKNVSATEPFLACMRVKTDELAVEDDWENGNGEGEGQQQGGGDSAAPRGTQINLLAASDALILAVFIASGL